MKELSEKIIECESAKNDQINAIRQQLDEKILEVIVVS